MLTTSFRTRLALAILSLAAPLGLRAQFVGNLDGTHISSTFTTSVDGTNALADFGWTSFSGVGARIFGQSGGTTNDVLIAVDGFANYGVQYNTGVSLTANTTYTLNFRVGYVSAGTSSVNEYSAQIGTWDGTTFSPLSTQTGSVNRASNGTTGASFGANFNNSISIGFSYVSPASGLSANQIAVRWAQTSASNTPDSDFFGLDHVTLSAVPEPGSFAGLCGLAALGFAATRRRRRED